MRVNARFAGVSERQVEFLTKATGQSVSDVLRASIEHYYEEVRAQAPGLRHFSRHIGAYRSEQADTTSRYKDILTDDLANKHGIR